MKVTPVSIGPTAIAEESNSPCLTPELLAATGARYSRSNLGLQKILEKIDPNKPDSSVDSIFRMIDYGHQSIADMAPVAMFIDGVSVLLAYHIWTQCPVAGGQETSTRYVKLDSSTIPDPSNFGIPDNLHQEWHNAAENALGSYNNLLSEWTKFGENNPDKIGIPSAVWNDKTPKGERKLDRMIRNYSFDRARYFIPTWIPTNVMLVMSARAWVHLAQFLLSCNLVEAHKLGAKIQEGLEISAPRMIKHARRSSSFADGIDREFSRIVEGMGEMPSTFTDSECEKVSKAYVDVLAPSGDRCSMKESLEGRENRYDWIGAGLRTTAVRFGWTAMGFSEIRDLNRHRTGTKFCPLVPQGFYYAADQSPSKSGLCDILLSERKVGQSASGRCWSTLKDADPSFGYWALCGTQFPFEHTTTGDKFIYESELRTGIGAHYRYADHMRETLSKWYEMFPETKGMVLEGENEPE